MSLPLLPGEHIADAFEQLVSALPPNVDERLRELCAYVENTWVTSRQWPPRAGHRSSRPSGLTTTARDGTTGWTISPDAASSTSISLSRFSTEMLSSCLSRQCWCRSVDCAAISGRRTPASKAVWTHSGSCTRRRNSPHQNCLRNVLTYMVHQTELETADCRPRLTYRQYGIGLTTVNRVCV